jgi:quinol-cytochrome oxidoreductase complex cytochrome b subunit
MTEKKKKNPYDRFIGWFDSRFGFEKTWLHNIPDFNLNPLYWLGIIMIVTFLMQGVTGIYMTMFYVPEPAQAHSSTTTIISSVPLGHFVETLHLYTAYAMIIVAFLHLVRNYFGSAHKKPRELMWVAGIIMLIIVLGFGLTGYLLPWTVISKSATDVAIGFTGYLPAPLATLGNSLLTGTGTDAAELTRFFSIHTIWLPAALLGFIALKIYMFEVHGPSYIPFYGKAKKSQMYPWFPKIFLYAVKLIALFVAILFALTVLFPLQLPPVYNPATASAYVIRPDWYFLAVYQVFKLGFFDGPNVPYAIFTIGLFFAILILLPFYDHSKRRGLSSRPVFVTAGLIALVEFIFLTVWGYLTPGQTVPAPIAIAGLLGVAGAVALGSGIIYAVHRRKGRAMSSKKLPASGTLNSKTMTSTTSATMFGLGRYSKFTALFLVLLGVASVALASITQTPIDIATNYTVLLLPGGTFAFSMLCLIWMVKKAVLTFEAESAKNKKGDFQNV